MTPQPLIDYRTPSTPAEAILLGYIAGTAGKPVEDCPLQGDLAEAWARGNRRAWEDAGRA